MSREYEFYVTVRGYELDSFGHMNNAVYMNYIEQAQWEILRKTDTFAYFQENRIIPAIIETTIRYIREAKVFDELVVRTRMVREPPYFVCKHVMSDIRTGLVSCKASVKQLYLTHERVPCDLSREILEKWGIAT